MAKDKSKKGNKAKDNPDANTVFDTPPAKAFFQGLKHVTVDPEVLRQEVLDLHDRRVIRNLTLDKKMNVRKLQAAVAQEQAVRSRCVAILVECRRLIDKIEPLKSAIILQLLTSYSAKIPLTTKTEKREYLVHGFTKRVPVLEGLASTIETIEYIIEDVDKSAFSLQRMIHLFDLSSRPEIH